MRKVKNKIELLEQHAMGSVEYDVLKVALESRQDTMSVQQSVEVFDTALELLELAFLRDEIKNIAKDFE
jgi:hypothetical protein